MPVMVELLSAIGRFLEDKYLFRDVLRVYAGILKEQKGLHQINCPDCEEKEKPCRKYYWLFNDIQEVEWMIQRLNKDLRETYS